MAKRKKVKGVRMGATAALYEQAKRILRRAGEDAGYAVGQPDFILACRGCGQPFPESTEMGMVEQHMQLAHGYVAGDPPFTLDLVWIGEGPPPKARS